MKAQLSNVGATALKHASVMTQLTRNLPAILAISIIGLAIPPNLATARAAENPSQEAPKNRKTHNKRSQQIRVQPSQNNSAETPAQRDRRLYRECRGLPNSGACAGYTYRR